MSDAPRPLITGSNGLLGRVVANLFEKRCPGTVSATKEFLDLEDFWRLRAELDRLRPTVVVNCAAYSDVDGCEKDPDRAFRQNRDTVVNLARACRAIGSTLVHVSTDYVFDGRAEQPYREEDPCGPLQVYGESKLEGEREAMREHPDSLVVRTSFLFGPGRRTFLDSVVEAGREGRRVTAVLDWLNAPTCTTDLAEALELLVRQGCRGIVHFTNSGACSKYEFAREVLRMAGLDPSIVDPVRLADLPVPAARPERTPLDLSRYSAIAGNPPRDWTAAAAECLQGAPAV